VTLIQRIVLILLLSTAMLAAGCSSAPGERNVFHLDTGFGEADRIVSTADTMDIGVPSLYNVTSQTVRVRKVSLVSAPPSVRLRGVTAHPGQPVGILHGNLNRLCSKQYPPHPVTDAVIRPHSQSAWFLVLAVTFARPGRYYLGQVKIYYTADGQNGWQYQNLHATLRVQAAQPGAKSRFDGCP
jgi:hypothetical protein